MYKNHLNLQDIHIGDWVQEYSEITSKFSMPMFVSAIFSDGTVYLDFNGNEGDVWEVNIEDIAPIKIDKDILKGFGFKEDKDGFLTLNIDDVNIEYGNNGYMDYDCDYIHTLQHKFYKYKRKPLVLNWEGI